MGQVRPRERQRLLQPCHWPLGGAHRVFGVFLIDGHQLLEKVNRPTLENFLPDEPAGFGLNALQNGKELGACTGEAS